MQTCQKWVRQTSERLSDVSDSPILDARLLLCHVLNISHSRYLTWPDAWVDEKQLAELEQLVSQRQQGKPLAYLTGHCEFWSLSLTVNPSVLIPRPDTETLVEVCLTLIKDRPNPRIADLGTGSGAIALALAFERSDATVLALDKSVEALDVARENKTRLGLNNVKVVQSDWLSEIRATGFDLIASNPPYVAPGDPHLKELTFEPDMALTAENDGLADLNHIIDSSREYLLAGGWLVVEHGYDQRLAVQQLFQQFGYQDIRTLKDLSGNDRVTLGRYSGDGR